jgi:hypothetical protein
VSDTAKNAAQTAAGASASGLTGQVTKVDLAGDKYTFVPSGSSTAMTVTYKSTDTFTVGASAADMGGFEANLTVADTITYSAGGTPRHDLLNVDPATIKAGMVGNIDETPTGQTFAFINSVTGDAVRAGVKYTGAGFTYKVDGADKDQAGFEADLSEGDSLTITGTSLALKNADVSGAADSIDKGTPLQTKLQIGPTPPTTPPTWPTRPTPSPGWSTPTPGSTTTSPPATPSPTSGWPARRPTPWSTRRRRRSAGRPWTTSTRTAAPRRPMPRTVGASAWPPAPAASP